MFNLYPIVAEAKTTLKLAAPLVVAQLLHIAMGFIDLVMVGRLGPKELAAGGLGATLWGITSVTCIGVLMAMSPIVAQFKGADDLPKIGKVFRQGIWLALLVGVVLLILTRLSGDVLAWFQIEADVIPLSQAYLKAIAWGMLSLPIYFVGRFTSEGLGLTRPIMVIQIVAIILNIVANYILIYGNLGAPKLGVEGAGWATCFVIMVNALLILAYLKFNRAYRRYALFSRFEWANLADIVYILRLSLPIAIGFVSEIGLFATVALLMGFYGTDAVAAHQIAINFASMMYMVSMGISMAITIRIGHAIGGQNPQAARFRAWIGVALVLLFMSMSAVFMFLLPETIARLYTQDETVIQMAVSLLFMAALFQISDGLQAVAAASLRGLKDTMVPMLAVILAYWLIGFPMAWWVGIYWQKSPVGLWVGLISGLSFAAGLLILRFHKLSKRMIEAA